MGSKNIFTLFIICVVLYFVFAIGPIAYRGIIGIRGICADQVNLYKKYDKTFVYRRVDEQLALIGVTEGKYEYNIKVDKASQVVRLEITYKDTAEFIGDYYKDFTFHVECESGTETVWK